jgi:isopropylmalate/homocitrate/citramalate synthase
MKCSYLSIVLYNTAFHCDGIGIPSTEASFVVVGGRSSQRDSFIVGFSASYVLHSSNILLLNHISMNIFFLLELKEKNIHFLPATSMLHLQTEE